MGPHGALKMRKFGLDDGRFYFFEGRPDFGYPYPPDFFPPHAHGMPFHPSGKNLQVQWELLNVITYIVISQMILSLKGGYSKSCQMGSWLVQ
jgi:hypothetical protein